MFLAERIIPAGTMVCYTHTRSLSHGISLGALSRFTIAFLNQSVDRSLFSRLILCVLIQSQVARQGALPAVKRLLSGGGRVGHDREQSSLISGATIEEI